LLAVWQRLFDVRADVQKALEEKRNEKMIGASLEASVRLTAGRELFDLLKRYEEHLPSLLIVSGVALEQREGEGLRVEVTRAPGRKCERCWNWSETVGRDARFPTLDERCVRQVEEGWEV
jgi:isoleucyl-tRNA synthetase